MFENEVQNDDQITTGKRMKAQTNSTEIQRGAYGIRMCTG
jgi:hypothetical protein